MMGYYAKRSVLLLALLLCLAVSGWVVLRRESVPRRFAAQKAGRSGEVLLSDTALTSNNRISVREPVPGATILSPVRFAGTTQGVNAVLVRLARADGTVVGEGAVTSTVQDESSAGYFEGKLVFNMPYGEELVMEVSAGIAHGSVPVSLVRIPVIVGTGE